MPTLGHGCDRRARPSRHPRLGREPKFKVVDGRPLWSAFRTQVEHRMRSEKGQLWKWLASLYDFVGAGKDRLRDHQAEGFGDF
jgi:hypothetical protein